MSVLTYDQEEVEINGKSFIIHAMPAEFGMVVLDELVRDEYKLSVNRMIDIIKRTVHYQNKKIDDRVFNVIFSRGYGDVGELFNKIMEFNFGFDMEEGEAPLDQTENQNLEGISEE